MSNKIIQGLWIGNNLSIMEQLSIVSFLKNGHEYHLYIYQDVKGIPKGTILKNADEIVLRDRIFKYKEYDTYAGFSNLFRYKLLFEKGGYWADTDVICLKPFNFESDYVFAQEKHSDGSILIASNVIKVPVGCEIMQFCYNICIQKDPNKLFWGEIGPLLLNDAVRRFKLTDYVFSYKTFNPIDWYDWKVIIEGELIKRIKTKLKLIKDVYAIHLWNEMWRRENADKDSIYHPQCPYEKLKKLYLNPYP